MSMFRAAAVRHVQQLSGRAAARQLRHCARRNASSNAAFALGLVEDRGPVNPFEVAPGQLLPGLSAGEFRRRRERLFEELPDNSALIVNASETKYMSHDIPYEFRQNSNFLYLTGLEEPDSLALLLKSQGKTSYILFVRPRDAHSEQWDGARIGLDGATGRYEADEAFQLSEMPAQFGKLLPSVERVFVMAPEGGRYSNSFLEATKPFHGKFFGGNFLVEQLRLIKSPAELDRMRFAADIGCKGFVEMMKRTRSGITELALAAEFESTCKRHGALWNSFPNVVGCGPNAAVIHYLSKRNMLKENELVLVDSGCEVAGGYASDITRTWNVGGTLSRAQLLLYEFTLDVQKKCLDHLRSQIEQKQSISLDQLHDFSVKLMVDGLRSFGILKSSPSLGINRAVLSEFQRYNPTHIGHYLGMDVHDTPHIPRTVPLVPGMVITVEPGIYLPKNDATIPQEFRGIGIRIEDDVVITETGIEITTSNVPKELADMEALREHA